MKNSTFRAFYAGVSLATLGVALPFMASPAMAQNNGSTQTTSPGERRNLYTVPGDYNYEAPVSGDVSPDVNGDPGPDGMAPDNVALVNCYDENDPGCDEPFAGGIRQLGDAAGEDIVNDIFVGIDDLGVLFPGAALTIQAIAVGTPFADAEIAIDAIQQFGRADTVSNTIDNEGTINVLVSAESIGANGNARADLTVGIDQSAFATSTAVNTLSLGDDGGTGILNIIVSADASGTTAVAGAQIDVAAIDQRVGGVIGQPVADNASNIIDNDGEIDIAVLANADGGATADAVASLSVAINQSAAATGEASNLIRTGDNLRLDILVDANAQATGAATALASIATAGIVQNAEAESATIVIENSGTIEIRAEADATSDSGFADADVLLANGVTQTAAEDPLDPAFDGTASVRIDNIEGEAFSLNVYAVANAEGETGAAVNARLLTGVVQSATAADASAVANGPIDVVASANVAAGNGAAAGTAEITSVGLQQNVVGLNRAVASISNDGAMDIGAIINGTGNSVNVDAQLNRGISQFASATAVDGTAAVSLVNDRDLNIFAEVNAFAGEGQASGSATMETAIRQFAGGAPNEGNEASISLVNNGNLNIQALADGSSTGVGVAAGNASMDADIRYGIYQEVDNNFVNEEGGDSVSIALQNNGNLDITAHAGAFALDGNANASANITSAGIYQFATGVDTASVSLTNGAGAINIEAEAIARASDGNAVASAEFGNDGIYQSANADDANASIVNQGLISLRADASAVADGGSARADAEMGTAVSQFAFADEDGTATLMIDNTGGRLSIVAEADAAGETLANADATISTGIYQTGTGLDVSATIRGPVDVIADANAFSTEGAANATASISNEGIYQGAYGDRLGSATISNDDVMRIAAIARAEGDTAEADATVETGIYQSATANLGFVPGGLGTSTVNLTNNGSVDILASAVAIADEGAADASATMETGVYQGSYAADRASATISNNGEMRIAAIANAEGITGADASASLDYGFYQSATADYGPNVGPSTATVNFTNTGSVEILVGASAFAAEGFADASAQISDAAIYQSAVVDAGSISGDSASVELANGGSLDIEISAYASGQAGASADARFTEATALIYQFAEANSATVDFRNTGSLDILIQAGAYAENENASALATALDTIIFQEAAGEDFRSVSLTNSDYLDIEVSAIANASEGAGNAVASVSIGILQEAEFSGGAGTAEGSSIATIDNDGFFRIAALADANVVEGDATARAGIESGILQRGSVANGGTSTVSLSNGAGEFIILAGADADSQGGSASGSATIGVGIEQRGDANDGGIATKDISNDGLMLIAASAGGTGEMGYGIASAFIDRGIDQGGNANGGGTADYTIQNSGRLEIAATALTYSQSEESATVGGAFSRAFIDEGILQRANADESGTVQLTIDNDGGDLLSVRALASAVATAGYGFAQATVGDGILQDGRANGDDGIATVLINNGTGDMFVGATANVSAGYGFIGIASASVDNGINQFAEADSASAQIVNSGTMSIVGNARYVSEAQFIASADVEIDTGIIQRGIGGDSGAATLRGEEGTVNVLATAVVDTRDVLGGEGGFAVVGGPDAIIGVGIDQFANAANEDGEATVDFEGELNVQANAILNGIGDEDFSGTVILGIGEASVSIGLYQRADAFLGDATVDANLSGGSIIARADVDARGTAFANAVLGSLSPDADDPFGAIDQEANGEELASINLTNVGEFDFYAVGSAYAEESNGYGTAQVIAGIDQRATADGSVGTAIVNFENSGAVSGLSPAAVTPEDLAGGDVFTIAALANATATEGVASANAVLGGTCPMGAEGGGTCGYAAFFPEAQDIIGGGVEVDSAGLSAQLTQGQVMPGIVFNQTATGNTATVNIANSGSINILASANADAEDEDPTTTDENANAFAYIGVGVNQDAFGQDLGSATIRNIGGELTVRAQAFADGGTSANADAFIQTGISQFAQGAGPDGSAFIALEGPASVQAFAFAIASDGPANATAIVENAILQTATAPDGTATINFANDGNMENSAVAIAIAEGDGSASIAVANADIDGMRFTAVGETAVLTFTNTDTFAVVADAFASADVFASANANVTYGISQIANGENLASVSIVNGPNDRIDIIAEADAIARNGTATAQATIDDVGIQQIATGIGGTVAEEAYASLVNSGTVDIIADAFASAQDVGGANAEARIVGNDEGADGLNQVANGLDTASVVLDNTGGEAFTLNIVANAVAIGEIGATASAFIGTGIGQFASATDVEGSATIVLNGPVRVVANADAILETGTALAVASVQTAGIDQEADGGNFASIRLTNDGVMVLAADAFAQGSGASALANYGDGISQSADLSGDEGTAFVGVANSGDLDIFAQAAALADEGRAFASAELEDGITQNAAGIDFATATVSNSGELMIGAIARASGATAATANAAITSSGIYQAAFAGEGADSGEARVSVVNTGSLDIMVVADAVASAGFALANGRLDDGIDQNAGAADFASALIENGPGATLNISVAAIARAEGDGDDAADASAFAELGNEAISQFSSATVGIASAIIENSGTISIGISADAFSEGSAALAVAFAGEGGVVVEQDAFAEETATVRLDNVGGDGSSFTILANARAEGETEADASATFRIGVDQFASASGDDSDAFVSIDGPVNVIANAFASAEDGNASAQAFFGTGINQLANAPDMSTVRLDNDGSMTVGAFAESSGTIANADASFTVGIRSVATGEDGAAANEAMVLGVNSGDIDVVAQAVANAQTTASASATFGVGVVQLAQGFDTATVTFDNTGGSLSVMALAEANAGDNALAVANFGVGVSQSASATDIDGDASVTLVGPVNVMAMANASATEGPASADAFFGTGINQTSRAPDNSSVRLDNSGTMTVGAFADVSGTIVNADASFTVGIDQAALGVGGGVPQFARVDGINDGTINIVAQAIAEGQTTASASALFETGLRQFAEGFEDGTIMFDNSGGELNIRATAVANAPQNALAVADFTYGVDQDARATATFGDAMASLVGPVNATAMAMATATEGTATANARIDVGILQSADAPDRATANFANSGSMEIGAIAIASAEALATATASLEIGILQVADFDFGPAQSASIGFANNGAIDIFAVAVATADDVANASAHIDTGIYQVARGGSFASIDGLGSGSIDIMAMAVANGDDGANANAEITSAGVSQYAYATQDDGTASISLGGEGGSLSVAAMASANAVTGDADADASIETGLYQLAQAFGEDGEARVSFTGMLDVTASAVANSDEGAAAADAMFEVGAGQTASATAGTAMATMNLEGGSIVANAIANAEDNASALAFVSTGINQIAVGEELASVALTNTGGLNLAVNAEANADGEGASANATAIMQAGINQSATADETASATLVNNGSIDAITGAEVPGPVDGTLLLGAFAQATAEAGDASANAVIGGSCDVAGEGSCDFGGEGPGGGTITVLADGLTPMLDVDDITAGLVINQSVAANNAQANFVNTGTINVMAMATANAGDEANALAYVGVAALQRASGGDTASVSLDNSGGELNVLAVANAFGGTAASAEAFIQTGVFQSAFATEGEASAALTGPISVIAIANATAEEGDATANAEIENGVVQSAFGDSATVTFSGALTVMAISNQDGDGAEAAAATVDGLRQIAFGGEQANIAYTNADAMAFMASATAEGDAFASANARVTYGIEQFAIADSATVSITNTGSIDVVARALASADGFATADASVGVGVSQQAFGVDSAVARMTGGGELNIAAVATAFGGTSAVADASVADGVFQLAVASGDEGSATAQLTGPISVIAMANATSTDGAAFASADVGQAVNQSVVAFGGTASASFDNAGEQSFMALAVASAETTAVANADIDGVRQSAIGNTATVSLNNSGSLAVMAVADAFGSDNAVASANVTYGVSQRAIFAETATASLINDGTISVTAMANAEATAGDASADANVVHGISQAAFFAGTASVNLASTGSISMLAFAGATAEGIADASATLGTGINQIAVASDTATVNLSSNDLDIRAIALASGDDGASANANLGSGVFQIAIGNSASAQLTSTGSLTIVVAANAVSDDGTAQASAEIGAVGINQQVISGEEATASISLAGATIAAMAFASGEEGAFATASGGSEGVYQLAIGEDADASLNSTGAVTIMADAGAIAAEGDASAFATLDQGIYQTAIGEGTASVSLNSGGPLTILADAEATAGGFAVASASVETAILQVAAASDANVSLTNDGSMTLMADADAVGALGAFANADILGIEQVAIGGTTAAATLTNTGDLAIMALAAATAGNVAVDNSAVAFATVTGISQFASVADNETAAPVATPEGGVEFMETTSGAGTASVSLANSGNLTVMGMAAANADTSAVAIASAVGATQNAFGSEAMATFTNEEGGTVMVIGDAAASGGSAGVALAFAGGIGQGAVAGDVEEVTTFPAVGFGDATRVITTTPTGSANVSLTNSGSILVGANADVTAVDVEGTPVALAVATAIGISQGALGTDVSVDLTNDGVISITGFVNVVGGAEATGTANVFGIFQTAGAGELIETLNLDEIDAEPEVEAGELMGEADVTLTNNGAINLSAQVSVEAEERGSATVALLGISQGAAGETATVSLTNDGTLIGTAFASASGTDASASANALGVVQAVIGDEGSLSFDNSNSFSLRADANATGTAVATASASAEGVLQLGGGDLDYNFNNEGVFVVDANANAAADEAIANATANGYVALGSNMNLTVSNSGTLQVTADASVEGTGTAFASAVGMMISAAGDGGDGAITGTIDNDGTLLVQADAEGATGTATAIGIHLMSGSNNATLTNTGAIMVTALSDDGSSTATGILVEDNGTEAAAAGDVFTINNNGGVIMARVSTDDGDTFQRGMAIDVHDAPNRTQINLRGAGTTPGQIYGNIDLQAGDNILVTSGETRFDGIINPEFAPQPLNQDPSPTFEGTLTIGAGGNLFLRDNSRASNADFYDGPSQAYVNTLTVQDGATLTYELFAGPSQEESEAHYPQIFANTANLNGTLAVRPINLAPNGLFDDEYYFDNIIEADVRNGQFDNLVLEGFTLGALINFEIIYDGQNNVDLGLTRTAFGQLGDETANQAAVGAGLEAVYDFTLTGDFADMLATFFTLDADEYYDALDQISGVEYPNYLHSLRNNTFTNNMFVNDQLDCAIDIRGVDACRDQESGPRFWVLGTYNDQELESTENFMGYDAGNWAGLLGVDYRFGNGFQLGAFAGYRSLDLDFRERTSNNVEADGWQIGLTAAYDVGSFYIRGVGSYSTFNGESERDIDFGGFGGRAEGEPDAKVWSIYGEAGARFELGSSWVTPFVGIDHTSIELEGFTETGVPGANLELDDQTEKQTSILGGLKWTGNFGGIVPEAKIAYRHDLGDGRLGVDMRFADAPAGSDFRKTEPYDRNSIIAGLSLAGVLTDRITGRLGYQGRFNDEVTDHAFYGSLTFKFGGAAPAPEPEPAPLPPPPPPPAAEPTPPPPAVNPGPFIVFFDWDRDEITPQAAAILDNAAAQYAQTGQAQVMIAGHADRSGSAQYNVGLSQRRAANVRSYLAGRGIPDGVMSTEAFGESRPLVETADGVREPQNRRVEINYGPGAGS